MSTKRSSDETSIYIIDRDYRLVHFNDALKRRFKDVRCGDFCYEKLCSEDRPCQGCPLNEDSDGAVMFYNKAMRAIRISFTTLPAFLPMTNCLS